LFLPANYALVTNGNGTVVQHSATDPEIKGLNPVAGFTKKKMAKKKS